MEALRSSAMPTISPQASRARHEQRASAPC